MRDCARKELLTRRHAIHSRTLDAGNVPAARLVCRVGRHRRRDGLTASSSSVVKPQCRPRSRPHAHPPGPPSETKGAPHAISRESFGLGLKATHMLGQRPPDSDSYAQQPPDSMEAKFGRTPTGRWVRAGRCPRSAGRPSGDRHAHSDLCVQCHDALSGGAAAAAVIRRRVRAI